MAEQQRPPKPRASRSSIDASAGVSREELLEIYLSLSPESRERRFVSTARAAELSGLSQRTIQRWIEAGIVNAVPVGKKYQVDLVSLRECLSKHLDG
jgi:excisionase family DNA binding protein